MPSSKRSSLPGTTKQLGSLAKAQSTGVQQKAKRAAYTK
jgi:hypothetical protein